MSSKCSQKSWAFALGTKKWERALFSGSSKALLFRVWLQSPMGWVWLTAPPLTSSETGKFLNPSKLTFPDNLGKTCRAGPDTLQISIHIPVHQKTQRRNAGGKREAGAQKRCARTASSEIKEEEGARQVLEPETDFRGHVGSTLRPPQLSKRTPCLCASLPLPHLRFLLLTSNSTLCDSNPAMAWKTGRPTPSRWVSGRKSLILLRKKKYAFYPRNITACSKIYISKIYTHTSLIRYIMISKGIYVWAIFKS